MISAPSRPYSFGAVCPEHGAGAALVLPFCTPPAMQLHLDEIGARVTAGAHAIIILDQAGWHGAKDLKISQKPIAPAAAAACARAQSARKYLAVHETELAVEPNLQILRRHRRSLLLRLEHPHRSALENHVHRTPRLGRRRSVNLRIGISPLGPAPNLKCSCNSDDRRLLARRAFATLEPFRRIVPFALSRKLYMPLRGIALRIADRISRRACDPPICRNRRMVTQRIGRLGDSRMVWVVFNSGNVKHTFSGRRVHTSLNQTDPRNRLHLWGNDH